MPLGVLQETSPEEKSLVDGTVADLRRTYLEYERKIHQLRKIRFMKTRPSAPKPFQRIISGGLRSPLSYRLVQAVTGMICKQRPSFKRLPMGNSDRDSASRLQASADPLLQDLERLARKPLYWHYVDALVADGRATMKMSRDVWSGFPIQWDNEPIDAYNNRVAQFVGKGATHPLRMRMVDQLNFKVPLVDYDPPYVMEAGKRPTLAVCNAFGLQFGTNNRLETVPDATAFHVLELPSGISPTIDVEELWFDDRVYVRIAGHVFKAENDLGFKPYVWSSGETSSNPDPSLANLSILYPFAGIEPWLNTMLTVLASWGVIGGTPILYTSRKLPPGSGGVPDVQPSLADIPLGKRIDLGIGGEIGFVTPPPVGREVLEFIKFLTDFLDRAGLPEMAYGSIGTRTPGTAFQGALEQAINKVNPIISSAEFAFADIVKMLWRIVEDVGEPMYVTGIGVQPRSFFNRKAMARYKIDPADIAGYYDLHAKIRVGNTQDVISRGMHAAFMRDKKLWSRDRAMEYADVDDPFEEYKNIMRDTLQESPLVQQITLQEALQQDSELAQRAQALQAQGVDLGQLLTGMGAPAGITAGFGAPAAAGGALATPTGAPGRSLAGAPGAAGLPAAPAPGNPAVRRPAPSRGGKVAGSPKRPGGNRGGRGQGSRGHS